MFEVLLLPHSCYCWLHEHNYFVFVQIKTLKSEIEDHQLNEKKGEHSSNVNQINGPELELYEIQREYMYGLKCHFISLWLWNDQAYFFFNDEFVFSLLLIQISGSV